MREPLGKLPHATTPCQRLPVSPDLLFWIHKFNAMFVIPLNIRLYNIRNTVYFQLCNLNYRITRLRSRTSKTNWPKVVSKADICRDEE